MTTVDWPLKPRESPNPKHWYLQKTLPLWHHLFFRPSIFSVYQLSEKVGFSYETKDTRMPPANRTTFCRMRKVPGRYKVMKWRWFSMTNSEGIFLKYKAMKEKGGGTIKLWDKTDPTRLRRTGTIRYSNRRRNSHASQRYAPVKAKGFCA